MFSLRGVGGGIRRPGVRLKGTMNSSFLTSKLDVFTDMMTLK